MTGKSTKYSKRLAAIGVVVLSLAGCADPPGRADLAGVEPSDRELVAFCYSGQATTREALFAMALEACPVGTRSADVWQHDTFYNACPLSKKNRVTFRCQGY